MDEQKTEYPRYVKLTEAGLKRLANRLKQKHVTREQLAGGTGIAINSIKKYLNGERTYLSKLERIFNALGLALTQHVDWEYDTEPIRNPRAEILPTLDEIPDCYKTLVFTDMEGSTKQWDATG